MPETNCVVRSATVAVRMLVSLWHPVYAALTRQESRVRALASRSRDANLDPVGGMNTTRERGRRGCPAQRATFINAERDDLVSAAARRARRGASLSGDVIRVLLVDDQCLMREALRTVLQSAPDIAVIGEAGNAAAAVVLAQRICPDVVLLDLEIPGGDGPRALSELVHTVPRARVLIVTMYPEEERLLRLLESGARGYITKSVAVSELLDAVRIVAAGEVYVSPIAARLLAADVVDRREAVTPRRRFRMLSGREQSVVQLLASGYAGVEVARKLGISGKTVDAYKRRIQDKLGLGHRTDYVRFALEAGILVS